MIFIDTSVLVSFEVETDQNHESAVELMNNINEGKFGEAIISDYIFDEIVTITLNKSKSLQNAVLIGSSLKSSTRIHKIDKELFEKSWEIFKGQKNTKFSFTDCSILAIMEKERIENLATFDKEFKKIKKIKVVD